MPKDVLSLPRARIVSGLFINVFDRLKKEFNSDSFYKETEINDLGSSGGHLTTEQNNHLHLQFSQTSGLKGAVG